MKNNELKSIPDKLLSQFPSIFPLQFSLVALPRMSWLMSPSLVRSEIPSS